MIDCGCPYALTSAGENYPGLTDMQHGFCFLILRRNYKENSCKKVNSTPLIVDAGVHLIIKSDSITVRYAPMNWIRYFNKDTF